jgi:prevent-host-death family protein
MAVKIKSSEVQQNFGRVVDQALIDGDVVVERYGEPKVVIVGYRRYQELVLAERSLAGIYIAQPERTPDAKELAEYFAQEVREQMATLEGTLDETMTSLRGRS